MFISWLKQSKHCPSTDDLKAPIRKQRKDVLVSSKHPQRCRGGAPTHENNNGGDRSTIQATSRRSDRGVDVNRILREALAGEKGSKNVSTKPAIHSSASPPIYQNDHRPSGCIPGSIAAPPPGRVKASSIATEGVSTTTSSITRESMISGMARWFELNKRTSSLHDQFKNDAPLYHCYPPELEAHAEQMSLERALAMSSVERAFHSQLHHMTPDHVESLFLFPRDLDTSREHDRFVPGISSSMDTLALPSPTTVEPDESFYANIVLEE